MAEWDLKFLYTNRDGLLENFLIDDVQHCQHCFADVEVQARLSEDAGYHVGRVKLANVPHVLSNVELLVKEVVDFGIGAFVGLEWIHSRPESPHLAFEVRFFLRGKRSDGTPPNSVAVELVESFCQPEDADSHLRYIAEGIEKTIDVSVQKGDVGDERMEPRGERKTNEPRHFHNV